MRKKTVRHIVLFASVLTIAMIAIFFIKGKSAQISDNSNSFENFQSKWADSVFQIMSFQEKIEQLIIIDSVHFSDSATFVAIEKNKFGGIIFEMDSIGYTANCINKLQQKVQIPFFVGTESALIAKDFRRLAYLLSRQELQCIYNNQLFDEYVNIEKNYFQLLGYNLNFLHYFSNNNLIYDSTQIKKIIQQLLLQVAAKQGQPYFCAVDAIYFDKNHGNKNYQNYFTVLRHLMQNGLNAVFFDTLTDNYNTALLCDSLLFKGLIISSVVSVDAAFIARQLQQGADMIKIRSDFMNVQNAVTQIAAQKLISENIIDKKVKKVLLLKAWLNLNNRKNENINVILDSLNQPAVLSTIRSAALQSYLAINNTKKVLPLQNLKNIAFFNYDTCKYTILKKYAQYYTSIKSYALNGSVNETKDLERIFNSHQTIIFAACSNFKNDIFSNMLTELVEKYQNDKNIIFIHFNEFEQLQQWPVLPVTLQMHRLHPLTEQQAAQLIFGGLAAKGFNKTILNYTNVASVDTSLKATRLAYVIPEDVNIKSILLKIVDSIIFEGINSHAMPGCQVWVAKDGKVFLHKSYGRTTYGGNSVDWTTMYDIASVTKIAATTIAAMKMSELNKINLNHRIGRYFKNTNIDYKRIKPDTTIIRDTFFFDEITDMKKLVSELDTFHLNDSMFVAFDTVINTVTPRTNIFNLTFRELLIHQSGISPSLPIIKYLKFKNDTVNNFNLYYSKKYIKDSATIQIAENLYFRNRYMDTLWNDIKQMKVSSRKKFQYSDANMVLLQMTFDTINKMKINQYLYKTFFEPLNLLNISFNPLKSNFPKQRIAPTELDEHWRSQLLQGYVHDPTAAILGGIAGNAGLFSNANDLGILFQMLLNGGTYGGIRYLNYQTIKTFISQQAENHRGLGFDRPSRKTIIAPSASKNSYGHTGFTGSCVWVDPDEKLVFIILTNRIHPSTKNWTFNKLKIRERLHQAIYNAIKQSKKSVSIANKPLV